MARLGRTGLEVFPLCLGGNVFGWTIDEARSFEVLDAYAAAGGNFIDTADIYGRRGAEGAGASEAIIGRWLAARGNREQMVIATKVGMSPELEGLSAQTIRAGVEASLARLGVETIDLYYAHRDDPQVPLEETLGTFAELIADGKIRHAGASNYSGPRLREALLAGERDGLASYEALQTHYNLVERGEYERELAPVCAAHDVPCLPYFALARGFLTGKYRRDGGEVESPRSAGVLDSYVNDRGFRALDALEEVATGRGASLAAVALAWLLAQPTVAAPVASATSMGQLAQILEAVELELSVDELDALERASA